VEKLHIVVVVVVTRNYLQTLVHWNILRFTMTAPGDHLVLRTSSTHPFQMLSKQWNSIIMCRWMVSLCLILWINCSQLCFVENLYSVHCICFWIQ